MRKGRVVSVYVAVGIAIVMALSTSLAAIGAGEKSGGGIGDQDDYDPLIDLNLTITIYEVWALDYLYSGNLGNFWWVIEIGALNDDDELEWVSTTSPFFYGVPSCHLYTDWSYTTDVSDSSGYVWVVIKLYNCYWMGGPSEICDISENSGGGPDYPEDASTAMITWNQPQDSVYSGDDREWGDSNGQFHLSGIQDGSAGYEVDQNDCDLIYSISQNDYDNDGLAYWEEVNVYGTNPKKSNLGEDLDGDGLPIEYEDQYLYYLSPFRDDSAGDADHDGLTNLQEYQLRSWGTRPDYPDILIEMDYETGYMPGEGVLDYVTQYFRNYRLPSQDSLLFAGANLIINVDEELAKATVDPNGDGTDDGEFQDVIDNHYSQEGGGAWRYMLVADKAKYEEVYRDPVFGNLIYVYTTMGYTLNAPPREMFIALGTIDERVDDYNDGWLDPDITLNHVIAAVILHELAHSLNIIEFVDNDGDGRFTEDYCDDPSCVMSKFDGHDFYYNIDIPNGPLFCSDHWSMLDLDVWTSDPLTTLPFDENDNDSSE